MDIRAFIAVRAKTVDFVVERSVYKGVNGIILIDFKVEISRYSHKGSKSPCGKGSGIDILLYKL